MEELLFQCGCPVDRCVCPDQFRTDGEICVYCATGNHLSAIGTFTTEPIYADEPQIASLVLT